MAGDSELRTIGTDLEMTLPSHARPRLPPKRQRGFRAVYRQELAVWGRADRNETRSAAPCSAVGRDSASLKLCRVLRRARK